MQANAHSAGGFNPASAAKAAPSENGLFTANSAQAAGTAQAAARSEAVARSEASEHHHDIPLAFWLTHWMRFICMIVLIASGFYIAQPFIAAPAYSAEPVNFLQAQLRFYHIVFGFVLLSMTLIKTYLFFFGRRYDFERKSARNLFSLRQWTSRLRFYLTLSGKLRDYGIYNPLQFVTYFAVYAALYGIIATGLILAIHIYHEGLLGAIYAPARWCEQLLGGIANVRYIHHVLTWVFIIFLPVHVYMASFKWLYKRSYEKAHL